MSILNFELEEVSKLCENVVPNSRIITCSEILVRVDIKQTETRQITVCLRFPENYPKGNLLVELKSRTLSTKFLDGFANIVEKQAKDILGKPQIVHVLKFISQYLIENPLSIVYEEIINTRKLLEDTSNLVLRQKTSTVILTAKGGAYYFKIKIQIPEEYPRQCLVWKEYESDLPVVLIRYLNGQSKEIARQCCEAPLRQDKNAEAFQPSPSLFKTFKFVIEATRDFCEEICPICKKAALPADPKDIMISESHDLYVERVYCGHLYHQICLKQYMSEPPFPVGGKSCPALKKHPRSDDTHLRKLHISSSKASSSSSQRKTSGDKNSAANTACGIRLAHDRWVVNIKVAEARWAQKQARQRELEEVIDFLQ